MGQITKPLSRTIAAMMYTWRQAAPPTGGDDPSRSRPAVSQYELQDLFSRDLYGISAARTPDFGGTTSGGMIVADEPYCNAAPIDPLYLVRRARANRVKALEARAKKLAAAAQEPSPELEPLLLVGPLSNGKTPPEPAPRVIEKLAAIQESDLTLTANFNFAPDDNNPERRRLHLSVGV